MDVQNKAWVWALVVVAVVAVLCCLAFDVLPARRRNTHEADLYDQVRPGMTRREIEELLGSPTQVIAPWKHEAIPDAVELRSYDVDVRPDTLFSPNEWIEVMYGSEGNAVQVDRHGR